MAPKINVKDRFTDGAIDLSMSDLEEVPIKDIALLKKAYSLDLSNNRLTVLPKHFPTLIHITVLDLSKNELKELPEDFGNLTKLRHLDLYQNHLEHLPLSFSKLKDLKWLDLKDNPLVPTVAKVAGPCLDTKQCQNCARDVVNFFMRLEQQVNSELENRNKTRQKQLELNQQKKQEEKKNKKKEKQKQRQEAVVTRKTSPGKVKSKKDNSKKSNEVAVKREERSAFRSIFIGLFISTSLLFILTSIKLELTKSFELYTISLYEKGLEKLPAGFRDYGVQGGQFIHNFHKKTGNITLSAINLINHHVISKDKYTEFVKKMEGLFDYAIEKLNDIYNVLVK